MRPNESKMIVTMGLKYCVNFKKGKGAFILPISHVHKILLILANTWINLVQFEKRFESSLRATLLDFSDLTFVYSIHFLCLIKYVYWPVQLLGILHQIVREN